MQYVHKIFPRIINGSFFEIVTKRPIAKHLKHFGGTLPNMMSLNWFIPAFVNINVGSSLMTIGAEGTI